MKRVINTACILLALVSCAKQGDDTANGPKARITIINAALDSDPVTLLLDGEKVNETPIAFGQFSGTAEDSYLNARPGVRNTLWQVGETPPAAEKFLQWLPGANYTLIQYDTAIQNVAPLLLVTDNLIANDSLAKGRFINCVAGDDTLSLWLIGPRDTVKVANRYPYLGKSGSFPTEFSANCEPGTRRIELIGQNGVVLHTQNIELAEKIHYSFVAFGESSGIGPKAPVVRIIIQLK